VVVGVTAELDDPSTEDVIISKWRKISADTKPEMRQAVDETLRRFGFKIERLEIRRANSIAVLFICLTLATVRSLRAQWCSGQFGVIIQKLFTVLSCTDFETVSIKSLSWPATDYERCSSFFSSVQGKQLVTCQ